MATMKYKDRCTHLVTFSVPMERKKCCDTSGKVSGCKFADDLFENNLIWTVARSRYLFRIPTHGFVMLIIISAVSANT